VIIQHLIGQPNKKEWFYQHFFMDTFSLYVGSMSDTGSDCTTLSKAVEKTLANEIKVKLLFL
jgi:hypothetical protein